MMCAIRKGVFDSVILLDKYNKNSSKTAERG